MSTIERANEPNDRLPHVCGALACRNEDGLRLVEQPKRGVRVLCPHHAEDYVTRGVNWGLRNGTQQGGELE